MKEFIKMIAQSICRVDVNWNREVYQLESPCSPERLIEDEFVGRDVTRQTCGAIKVLQNLLLIFRQKPFLFSHPIVESSFEWPVYSIPVNRFLEDGVRHVVQH